MNLIKMPPAKNILQAVSMFLAVFMIMLILVGAFIIGSNFFSY